MEYKKRQSKVQVQLRYKFNELFNGDIEKSYFKEFGPSAVILKDGRNNLYSGIVEDSLGYFRKNNIAWWGEFENRPSGHLLSSQVQCLNFLFVMRKNKSAILKLAQLIDPKIDDVIIIPNEADLSYLAFEFIHKNEMLLKENDRRSRRGQFCTSIDVLLIGKKWGKCILLPIEWKYTEEYQNFENKALDGSKGLTRQTRYNELIANSFQLKTVDSISESIYYYEPYYEFMRQTLLVEQMVNRGYADDFIHVLVMPEENKSLLNKSYACESHDLVEAWKSQLTEPERFIALDSLEIFKLLTGLPVYDDQANYLRKRYYQNMF